MSIRRGTKRYQIITHSRDSGTDEKLEYYTIAKATSESRQYRLDDYYDGVIIYDLVLNRIVREYGCFPESSRPSESPDLIMGYGF